MKVNWIKLVAAVVALVAVSGCAFKGLNVDQMRDRFAASEIGRVVIYSEVTHTFEGALNDQGCKDLQAGKFDERRLAAGVTKEQIAKAVALCQAIVDGGALQLDGVVYGKLSEMVRASPFFAKKSLGVEVGDVVRIEGEIGVIESFWVTRIAAKKKDRESTNCGWQGLKAMFTGGIVCRDEWDYREQPAFTGKRSNVVK